jgi:hypothetical protein
VRDGFKITFWTYFEPMPNPLIPSADSVQALQRLHGGRRQVAITSVVCQREGTTLGLVLP